MKVWVIETCADYEGCSFYAVFSTEKKALAEKARLEKLSSEYMDDQEKTDYCSELPYPERHNESIYIKECEVQ
jgi:hypothetical protein